MLKIHQVTLLARFYNRGSALRPINRIKHVFDKQDATVAGTAKATVIAAATDTPTLGVAESVETGSKINGFYIKCEAYATSSAALANMYFLLFKNPGNKLGNPAPNAVGVSDDKRWVIHQEMIMFQKQTDSNPRTLFNGVIVVPRGMRRMAPNDK